MVRSESNAMPSVLVLTLYSGEGEYGACKQSIASQKGVHFEHVCFEWLSNIEAHEALYREIMKRSHEFDCFVKIDADMVLASSDTLAVLSRSFLAEINLDHLSLPVYDVPSESYLMGFHIFSSRAQWTFPADPLFPDKNPDIPGARRIDYAHQRKYIYHMPSPTKQQAFSLGYHRATKIAQANRRGALKSAAFPLSYLKRVSKSVDFNPELKNLVLVGMFAALISNSGPVSDKSKIDASSSPLWTARTLARLCQVPISRDFIFLGLRIRYNLVRKLIGK